ncbi:MAG: glucose 1-dehydrogenase [Alphaproteobacteria bacterium]|nr:glucose 1-dehydrogenase [Alphaproteobacteria bacterium]MCW5739253.1 glucose 1-dehydrogenase [Alphaproteobacteria bacterium]
MADLDNRVAIVTGGASGIGAASCRLLAREGAIVVVADVQDDLGEKVARDIGGTSVYRRLDVTREADWQRVVDDTLQRCGRLDILVNNAGISGGMGNIETTTVENWERVHAINLDGVFLGCKHGIGAMKRTGPAKPASQGAIVNISSIAGIVGAAGPCAYTASKGAVRLLTKSVAQHCAEKGYAIRCNSVHPGGIDTPIFNLLWQVMGHEAGKAFIGARHPIGHMGEPEDIAEAVLYLASDRSRFVTGSELVADGGITSGIQRTALNAPR